MEEVNVFELDPASFRLKHEIVADGARWNPALKTWVFENGWSAEFRKAPIARATPPSTDRCTPPASPSLPNHRIISSRKSRRISR